MAESTLTRQAIVAEAVRIADVDGLDRVSMRRIAERLDTGAMSLYRHVPDKDALIQGMAAEVGERFSYPPQMLGDPDWRRRAMLAAEIDMELYQRHPWVLLAHASPRGALSQASVTCFDWLVEAFTHLTAAVDTAAELALHLWDMVQGAGLSVVGQALVSPGTEIDRAGFVARLGDLPFVDDLPRVRELVALDRTARRAAYPSLQSGIEALCDGFALRFDRFDAVD